MSPLSNRDRRPCPRRSRAPSIAGSAGTVVTHACTAWFHRFTIDKGVCTLSSSSSLSRSQLGPLCHPTMTSTDNTSQQSNVYTAASRQAVVRAKPNGIAIPTSSPAICFLASWTRLPNTALAKPGFLIGGGL